MGYCYLFTHFTPVVREWKESQEAEDLIGMPGRFPVHVIDDANHGQVIQMKCMLGWIFWFHNIIQLEMKIHCSLKVSNFSFKVASGSIPEFVTSQDIPSPISFEEAHSRYATSVAAFITVQSQELFTDEEVSITL